MHFEPHATLGWMIGNVGGGDHRVRTYCTVGAVLPDIDAATYAFGPLAYGQWHHTFGHNVFLWVAFTGLAAWHCRSWRAAVLAFLSFGSHLLTDAQLSGWKQYLLWPVSRHGYIFPSAVQLEHPINYWLVYVSFAVVLLMALWFQRTPIDIFSPKLDRLLLAAFRKKDRACSTCGADCNQICDGCGRSVCLRHGRVRWKMRIHCPACVLREKEAP